MSTEVGLYLRFSVGHKGQFGNELLKFEVLSTGELTYCNDSNYKMEGSIERKCRLTPILIQHISSLIYNSGILQQSDTNWPLPDQVGREELEIIIHNRHVSFTTTKLGSLAEALGSKDPKGLEIFYYLTVELKWQGQLEHLPLETRYLLDVLGNLVGRNVPIEIHCSIQLPLALLVDLWGLERGQEMDQSEKSFHGDLSVVRRMSDSYCELSLPFLDNKTLLEEYVAFYGGIRFGKLLEDLDILAACIAYSHCQGNFVDISIVTAAVDRIDILAPFQIGNYFLQGNVTFVGRSSMEVTILVRCNSVIVAVGVFTMVARCSSDHSKAQAINQLVLENDQEEMVFSRGKLNKERKIALKSDVTTLIGVNGSFPHGNPALKQKMQDTVVISTRLCHSQERNIHNFIFGGYLMREAYDTAYIVACKFTKASSVTMESLDEIIFHLPVPIGSILEFTGQVIYVEGEEFCISIISHITNPKYPQQTKQVTNTFYFTFKSVVVHELPQIVPTSQEERMAYSSGKRRYEAGKQARLELCQLIKSP